MAFYSYKIFYLIRKAAKQKICWTRTIVHKLQHFTKTTTCVSDNTIQRRQQDLTATAKFNVRNETCRRRGNVTATAKFNGGNKIRFDALGLRYSGTLRYSRAPRNSLILGNSLILRNSPMLRTLRNSARNTTTTTTKQFVSQCFDHCPTDDLSSCPKPDILVKPPLSMHCVFCCSINESLLESRSIC